MNLTHYECNVSKLKEKLGLDLEAVWQRDVVPKTGDRMISRLDLMKYEPFTRSLMPSMLLNGSNENDLVTVISDNQAMYNFWRAGKRVFTVSRQLTEMLIETDLKVAKFFLKLPFPCVFIRFSEAPVEIHCDEDDTWIKLDGVYVYEYEEDIFDNGIGPDIGKVLTNEDYGVKAIGKQRRLKMVAISKSEREDVYQGNLQFSYVSWEGSDTDIVDEDYIVSHADRMANDVSQEMRESVLEIWKMVLPAIAYINSVGADVAQRKSPAVEKNEEIAKAQGMKTPPAKLFSKARILSKIPYYSVGSRIQIPQGNREQITTQKRGIRTFHYRHMVRGHMRSYWKKTDNLTEQERNPSIVRRIEGDETLVLKFVAPFWRGPTTGDLVNRQYQVDVPPEQRRE